MADLTAFSILLRCQTAHAILVTVIVVKNKFWDSNRTAWCLKFQVTAKRLNSIVPFWYNGSVTYPISMIWLRVGDETISISDFVTTRRLYEFDRTWWNPCWSLPFCSIFQDMICVWSSFVFSRLDLIEGRQPSGRQPLLSFDKGTTLCFNFSGSLSSYRIGLCNLTGCVKGITCWYGLRHFSYHSLRVCIRSSFCVLYRSDWGLMTASFL